MNTLTGLYTAICGSRIYHRLFQNGSPDEETHVFVLIEKQCEKYFRKYLPEYIDKYHPKQIIYIKEKDGMNTVGFRANKADVLELNIKNDELSSFMYYVVLFSRDKNIRFLSYEKPFGRNGRALIGVKGTGEEEMFSIGIMGLNGIL